MGLWKFVELVKPAPQYCGVCKVYKVEIYKVDYSPPTVGANSNSRLQQEG